MLLRRKANYSWTTTEVTPSRPQMAVTEPLPYRLRPVIGVSTAIPQEVVYLRQVERGNVVFGGGAPRPLPTLGAPVRCRAISATSFGRFGAWCRRSPMCGSSAPGAAHAGTTAVLLDKLNTRSLQGRANLGLCFG